jgi:molybdate transport system substrate-binding protein
VTDVKRGANEVRRHPVRAIIPGVCLWLLVLLASSACGTSTTGAGSSPTTAAPVTNSAATLDIPDALNSIATYPIGVVKASQNASVAQQFVDYVAGLSGQAVLAQYGFVAGSSGPQYKPAS